MSKSAEDGGWPLASHHEESRRRVDRRFAGRAVETFAELRKICRLVPERGVRFKAYMAAENIHGMRVLEPGPRFWCFPCGFCGQSLYFSDYALPLLPPSSTFNWVSFNMGRRTKQISHVDTSREADLLEAVLEVIYSRIPQVLGEFLSLEERAWARLRTPCERRRELGRRIVWAGVGRLPSRPSTSTNNHTAANQPQSVQQKLRAPGLGHQAV
ncbi:hypothetical protein B0H16DRAFT_1462303 [Mycena metata]|uniref:Uncharacterized protein n=1 Tax=Mycena metata TaxID=1033252 RepID=A0AAD7N714_9AGAR|nr:hypothetical protein B0H16DRAFT_1462303 [Mycena metata]